MARGWISGENPLTFDPQDTQYTANGLTLFLCQVVIILSLCYILGNVFQRVGQPRVVGELLAGVVLGPTAFGSEHENVARRRRYNTLCAPSLTLSPFLPP